MKRWLFGWLFAVCMLFHSTCYAAVSVYYSQCGQDKFVHERYFRHLNSGVFIDIGAHDGKTYSNTYFFEQQGWTGICIEPLPQRFAELQKQRHCVCVQGCVTDHSGKDQLLMVTSPFIDTEMLSGLLKKYDPRHLDRVDKEVAANGGFEAVRKNLYISYQTALTYICKRMNVCKKQAGFKYVSRMLTDNFSFRKLLMEL